MNVNSFLYCETPDAWLASVADNLPLLLIDHANCEKKAASTALNLMYRQVGQTGVTVQLSKLAREELRHFEQVMTILKARHISYARISSSRYAGELRRGIRTHEPARLIDTLLVSAVVEARSCERFSRLATVLDDELADFYRSLLASEARHFAVYLGLAEAVAAGAAIEDRVHAFLAEDRRLISTADPEFRFHSGVPAS